MARASSVLRISEAVASRRQTNMKALRLCHFDGNGTMWCRGRFASARQARGRDQRSRRLKRAWEDRRTAVRGEASDTVDKATQTTPKDADDDEAPTESAIKPGQKRPPIRKIGRRRIVDIDCLARHLWCFFCKRVMSLSNIEKESVRGLRSILHVRCDGCRFLHQVPTGNLRSDSNRGGPARSDDVNLLAVSGACAAGIAYNELARILAALDLPIIPYHTYRKCKISGLVPVNTELEQSSGQDSCVEIREERQEKNNPPVNAIVNVESGRRNTENDNVFSNWNECARITENSEEDELWSMCRQWQACLKKN